MENLIGRNTSQITHTYVNDFGISISIGFGSKKFFHIDNPSPFVYHVKSADIYGIARMGNKWRGIGLDIRTNMMRIVFLLIFFSIAANTLMAQDKFYPSVSLEGLLNCEGTGFDYSNKFTNVSLEGDYNYFFWRNMSIGIIGGFNFIKGPIDSTLIKLGGVLRFFFGQDYRSDTALYIIFGRLISTDNSKFVNNTNHNDKRISSIFIRPIGFRFRITQFNLGEHKISLMGETYLETSNINLNKNIISVYDRSSIEFVDFGLGLAFRF